jgi:osmotically-inducible protein OsmY
MKTDAQLQQDVMAELAWEPAVHAAQIGVEVKDGVVTLAGEVSSFGEKWAAEEAAQRVHGVMALAVALTVKLSQFGGRSDADLAQAAKNVLSWCDALPADAVHVQVEGGWLTLSGTVPWQYQRLDAAAVVRHLPGLLGLSNQIAVQPDAPTRTALVVQNEIEAAIQRAAGGPPRPLGGSGIAVRVQDAGVTLSGSARSRHERDMATRSAWRSTGVRTVADHMSLLY